ncbi:hypothetical protein [Pectobacterium parmentieri]|uniref:hypothetical protein n=1 Tax=Pectobacterium parmentieri TaxID=1905730 RepID=UPI000CDDE27D|nr:hypothetical protein [Pectobacterium parmentieri]AYH04151.1 hypothetical protein C5E25_01395 [Pectobacterium parmentieri]AYH12972.1 hypothetical protein C5E23_01380 [Pectobacterium parmentieri]AYH21674.1 hypothetical protein C5E21_01375 [Pectobacterium parmentieri]MBN3177159.1 hypothetical protein [Pectobacterium parmentieri]POW25035.1 hypothetical protein PB20LOC_03575 [Pectobacterium parmentieri]
MRNKVSHHHNLNCEAAGPINYIFKPYPTKELKSGALDYAIAQSIFDDATISVYFLPGGRWEKVFVTEKNGNKIDPWSVTKDVELAKNVILKYHPQKPTIDEINSLEIDETDEMLRNIVLDKLGKLIDLPIQKQGNNH